MQKTVNRISYFGLFLTFLIFILPPEFKVQGYSLNIVGWIWIVAIIPLTVISFLYMIYVEAREKKWRNIAVRSTLLILIIVVSVAVLYNNSQSGTM